MRTAGPSTSPILRVNGASLQSDASGALFWPEEHTLVLADLHLEKASSFAPRGSLLPPYDTRATLGRIALLLERHRPRRVICLGDSLHDGPAATRLDAEDALHLARMVARHDWIWLAGNHDPAPPPSLGGTIAASLAIGPLVFRHQAREGPVRGEISGHFHPTASLRLRAGRRTARCFVGDGHRLILPAFGALTGGLDIFDPAVRRLFPRGFEVHALGRASVVPIAPDRIAPAFHLSRALARP